MKISAAGTITIYEKGGHRMVSVGIDISKGKSTVCILKPYGEIVCSPFEVMHVEKELESLAELLQRLDGENNSFDAESKGRGWRNPDCDGSDRDLSSPDSYFLSGERLFHSGCESLCNEKIRKRQQY